MELTHDILARLDQLEAKYKAMGQNMQSYLDGLLHADYLTYWDYIHLDTLLSLQNEQTQLPDERIFIIYHQITELYFRLILDAIERVTNETNPSVFLLKRQLERINRYFDSLVSSFDIMVDGMDKDEFLKFRMSLLPASGFQSAQFRQIEIMATDFQNLIHFTKRESLKNEANIAQMYDALYWKQGATELKTGEKTLTLKQFELKYAKNFIELADNFQEKNLWKTFKKLPHADQNDEILRGLFRTFDFNINVLWRLSHYRSAVRFLENKPQTIAATGGTNWQDYLPPKTQRIVFYPELWTEDEINSWGKKIKF